MQHTIMLSLENDNEKLASIMDRVITASSGILSASKHSESDKQFTISKAMNTEVPCKVSHVAATMLLE
ncbi:reticulate body protein Rbp-7 [Chlamydia trachomatis]|jgi:hypothetical protein|uniref:Uncharacterized protein n=1 Tax=Chlamydia muridarum TaxID=83560 RepID=A0A069ZNA9_CHLMR|nr:reticulate body protein Rbp-7 [Chlamydia muridarum]UFV53763.1 reticulate body protein Rbp-7 [Chlamydia trachomatis]AHH22580.1 hypothetical protein TAC_00995 [Chlamydia muridarum str. Nigg3 CMUT3-5]AHH23504.1 hypothetical protein Y015_00995 [Chlamydia muridarum str. Nigg CM972]AID37727.1 hypothetical protein BB17_01015 [Chlamydia muridarum str. Nigg 2 MCR]AIT90407.1 hypothetical protein NC80_00950 [Chlamydia muridarum]